MKEGHIMEMRYSIVYSTSYDMCTYQPSHLLLSCDGCVVHDDNKGFQPPLAKRSKVDPPPSPSPQVSHYTESVNVSIMSLHVNRSRTCHN